MCVKQATNPEVRNVKSVFRREWGVENEGMHGMPEIWRLDEAVELQTSHHFVIYLSIYLSFK